jgi:hypothetical protein
MNQEEAKAILQACRPGGRDAGDPLFAEALALAQRDPELQKWLAQEQALDAALQAKLREAMPIPFGLKTRLLAQRKAIRPKAWWLRPAWFVPAAAALVLFAALAAVWVRQANAPQFAALRETLLQNSMMMDGHLGLMAQDMTKIQDWLKEKSAPADFALPAALHDAMLKGCKVLDWHGQKVTMLCLGAGGKHMDLFVIDCTRFRDFTPTETAQFAQAGGMSTAIWRNGQKTYLLAASGEESMLRKLL